MMAMTGGRGAAFAAGPGFDRLIAPPFREASNRDPVDALKVLLAAGANPNAKAPDGTTLLHQAVTARQVRHHPRAGRGRREARRRQQGQPDAAAAGRKAGAAAAAGQQHRSASAGARSGIRART